LLVYLLEVVPELIIYLTIILQSYSILPRFPCLLLPTVPGMLPINPPFRCVVHICNFFGFGDNPWFGKKFAILSEFLSALDLYALSPLAGPLDLMVLAGSLVQNSVQNLGRIIGFSFPDFVRKHRYQTLHLSLGQAGIEPDVKMGLQLGVDPFHAG
jgi:hypothetical protein